MNCLKAAFVLLLVCLDCVSSAPVWAKEKESAGAIVTVKDLAFVVRGKARIPARPGDSVYAHDVIDTSKAGGVKLLLNDQSVLDLGPSTRFRIDQYLKNHGDDRTVGLTMLSGTLRSAITKKITGNGKFHVRTPTATMGVRGTEFVVQASNSTNGGGTTRITVLQGQVAVAKNPALLDTTSKALTLSAGQQVTASSKAPLPTAPVLLDAASMSKLSSSSKLADNTFSKAVTIATNSSGGNGSSTQGPANSTNGRAPASTSSNSSGESSSSSGASSASASAASGSNAPAATSAPADSASSGGTQTAAGNSGGNAPSDNSGAPPPPPAASGGSTLADIGTAASTVAAGPPPVTITQAGISGTFSPTSVAAPVATQQTISNVTIIITRQ